MPLLISDKPPYSLPPATAAAPVQAMSEKLAQHAAKMARLRESALARSPDKSPAVAGGASLGESNAPANSLPQQQQQRQRQQQHTLPHNTLPAPACGTDYCIGDS